MSYLIYGEFGEDERDVGFKDTRWVELTGLLYLKSADTKKLIAYEKALAQRMAACNVTQGGQGARVARRGERLWTLAKATPGRIRNGAWVS